VFQADLEADPVVRGRPIILNSKDWHAIWVSSKVLEDNSPLPETVEGGIIVREDDGRPTGWFSLIVDPLPPNLSYNDF